MDVSNSFLKFLTEEDLEWWFLSCSDQKLGSGETLIEEGKPIDSIYFVESGALDIFVASLGKRQLATIQPGGILGEMSFVEEVVATATAIATEETLLRALPKISLNERILSDNDFAIRFYKALAKTLSERLREHRTTIRELLALTAAKVSE